MATKQVVDSDPIDFAAKLRPLLARNTEQAERDRRLPAETIEALQVGNLFKVMVPRRWGGYGSPLPTVWAPLPSWPKDAGQLDGSR
jgi:alkylation response protein AidB-like acyl-CoA dehydrogenase